MFGRRLITWFDIILPKNSILQVEKHVLNKQQKQRLYYKGNNRVEFAPNELTLVKYYRTPNKVSWIKGRITKRIGKYTYLVKVARVQKTWKRHSNQIRKLSAKIFHPGVSDIPTKEVSNTEALHNGTTINLVKQPVHGNIYTRSKRVFKTHQIA